MASWAITAMLCLGVYLAFANGVRRWTCNFDEIRICRSLRLDCVKNDRYSCNILCTHPPGGPGISLPRCSPDGQVCGVSGNGRCNEDKGSCRGRCDCMEPAVEYR